MISKRVGEWNCVDRDCIEATKLCNGVKDCTDGSDETIKECSQVHYNGYLFRCTYGVCVHYAAACNGVEECADGSDESLDLCSKRGIIVGPTEIPTTPSASDRMCVLPPYPDHGTYTATQGVKPGDAVSHTALTYSCEWCYSLIVEGSPICFFGYWFMKMPTCEISCGRIMSPISGGTDSKNKEFPWKVEVLHCWIVRCGGLLIGPKVALSAGGCGHNYRQQLKVCAGDWNLDNIEGQKLYQEQLVNKIIVHPQYKSGNESELRYDATLLVMESPFTLADNIAFICLPPLNLDVASTSCKMVGFGHKYMTTGYQTLGLDHYFARGLTSFNSCDNLTSLVSFTDIVKVRRWIDQEMRANGFSTDTYTHIGLQEVNGYKSK